MPVVSSGVGAAAQSAKAAFNSMWTAVKGAGKQTYEAGKQAAYGVGNSVKTADIYVKDMGGFGKTLEYISKEHPVYTTIAGVGLTAGAAYGGYKAIGHFTGREEARRAARDNDRPR